VIDWASRIFLGLSGILIVIMVFLTSYGVIRRYAFNSPEPYSYEMNVIFLLFSFIFAVSAVEMQDRHIRVDFISNRLPEIAQQILLNIIAPLLGLFCCLLLTWKSLDNALFSLGIGEVSSSIWKVPLFPIKIMVPLGYALLGFTLLARIYKGLVLTISHKR
jgi:TRAP-type C4-dicarboxylate transport system permease small subunit